MQIQLRLFGHYEQDKTTISFIKLNTINIIESNNTCVWGCVLTIVKIHDRKQKLKTNYLRDIGCTKSWIEEEEINCYPKIILQLL